MSEIACNPGSWLAVEGRLAVAGERIYLDGQPLDELIRGYYLQELEHHVDSVLTFGPTRLEITARPIGGHR